MDSRGTRFFSMFTLIKFNFHHLQSNTIVEIAVVKCTNDTCKIGHKSESGKPFHNSVHCPVNERWKIVYASHTGARVYNMLG